MSGEHRGRPVVVGVDGSKYGLRAVRWGAAEAARRGVPLRLVHSFEWVDDRSRTSGPLGAGRRDAYLDRARRVVAAAALEAAQQDPGIEIEQQVIVGFAIGVLSAESMRAQLVVVGDRGHSRIEGMLMGSVPVGLVVHAACPVVVARGVESDGPVVVGIDGSAMSEAAIAFAFEAASARRVRLVAVHAWSEPLAGHELGPLIVRAGGEDDERRLLAERLAGWSGKFPDVHVERVLASGRPTSVLLELSTRAQLVVVGSRRHGDFTGLVLGSVSNTLVHKAGCPVAVVQPDTRVGPDAVP